MIVRLIDGIMNPSVTLTECAKRLAMLLGYAKSSASNPPLIPDLVEREMGREVLFGNRGEGVFRLGKDGVGRANPDAVQQCIDRQ